MALLEVDQIELSFSGLKVLKNVSVSIEEKQILAIIGPNGAGKTSLFNCISGVYKPQKGKIDFEGQNLVELKPFEVAKLGVSRMFQNLALFENLTVQENLLLGCNNLYKAGIFEQLFFTASYRKQELEMIEKVEWIIDFLDLAKYRQSLVMTLPYGILKRIELGRALLMNPKLLLLDEPAAGLNQEESEDIARYIIDIRDQMGISQILIEHELRMVLELADNIAVLDFGQKIADAPPAEIMNDQKVKDAYLGKAANL